MPTHIPISQWGNEEQPRERLLQYGVGVLSEVELIALLLNTGSRGSSAIVLARLLLKEHGDISALGKCSPSQLAAYRGMGPAKVARLLAACELGRRREARPVSKRVRIHSAHDAAQQMFVKLRELRHEALYVLLLDTKHQLLGNVLVGQGSVDQIGVQPREVFRPAIEISAAAVIVCHNHPSGDPEPSMPDIQLTKRLQAASQVIGIRLLDHIIIGDGVFISLAEKGYCNHK
ncbi:DNA repair protein RadC [bacterium]|nr:DNA repair protein RadC [bacterium]